MLAAKLNVRSGPGENFGTVGQLEKGATVKELRKKNDWLEIEAPVGTSAFVAASFIDKQVSSAPLAPSTEVTTTTIPVVTNLPPAEVVMLTPDTNDTVAAAVDAPAAPVAPAVVAPAPAVVAAEPVIKDEILPKRIVNREGILRKSINIQAPADYELRDLRTGELLDYISPLKSDLDLKPFVGSKVIVSGEEAVDARWKFTPLIKVETIDVL